jgi:transposase
MLRFVGLDVHKKVVQACFIDSKGKLLSQRRFPCFRDDLIRFGRTYLKKTDKVALEATTHCWEVAKVLKPFVARVVVSNPKATKAIAHAKVKTDKVDANILAELLRCDFLPTVWEPDEKTRELRSLTVHRTSMGQQRTAVKNRIHAILHQRLIQIPEGSLFAKENSRWLEELELDPAGREALLSELRLLGSLSAEVEAADHQVILRAYEDPRIKLLMTAPGIDFGVASAVVAAYGDIHRFKTADQAASYLGLVPSTKQSADKCYHGPITKHGNSQARWMLTQAAQVVSRHPGPLGAFFRNLAARRTWNIAVLATARKLAVIIWHMLKRNEPYRYAEPATVKQKLGRLRTRATGQNRKSTPRKTKAASPDTPDQKAPEGYRFAWTPSLNDVLEAEGLPPQKPLSAGEQSIIDKLEMMHLVGRISTQQRKLRKA